MATQAKFPRTRRDAYKEIEVIVPRGRDRSYQSEWSPISHLQRQVTVAPTRMSASHATLASYDLTDSVDYKHVGILDVLCDVYSIGTFLFDVGSDIWLVSIYAHMGHWWWFGLTLACIVTSSVVSTFFSLVWYIQDNRFNKKHKLETASGLQWVVRISFTFLLMLPILRYVDAIVKCIMCQKVDIWDKKQELFTMMLYEEVDASLLRLFDCFIEAGPQLLLQLYIMLNAGIPNDHFRLLAQVCSVSTSMISIAWSLVAYHRILRRSLKHKEDMTIPGLVIQFLWLFFVISARVLALALFASQFQIWVFVVIGIHWVAMVTWIQFQRAKFCEAGPAWQELSFSMVAAVIHILCFFNLKEGHTRLRYATYYFLMYIENMVLALLWYLSTQTQEYWYQIPCMVMIHLGFIVGVVLQIIYYLKFHPNNKIPGKEIKLWIPCSELQHMGRSAPETSPQFTRGKKLAMNMGSVTMKENSW